MPIQRADRAPVLASIRSSIGWGIPWCERVDADVIEFEWVEGIVPSGPRDIPVRALERLGGLLATFHRDSRRLKPAWGYSTIAELPRTAGAIRKIARDLDLDVSEEWQASCWNLSWTHGDISPWNVVLLPNYEDIAAIIDWEFMAWDLPILDIAHALWRTVPWSGSAERSDEEWLECAGRSSAFLRGYGWTGPAEDLLCSLLFLLDRRFEVITDGLRREDVVTRSDWRVTLDLLTTDSHEMRSSPSRYLSALKDRA